MAQFLVVYKVEIFNASAYIFVAMLFLYCCKEYRIHRLVNMKYRFTYALDRMINYVTS